MTDRMDWDDDQSSRRQSDGGGGGSTTIPGGTAPGRGYAQPGGIAPGQGYAQSGGFDPGYAYGPMGGGYGNPYAMRRPMRTFPIETKPFFMTSEFAAYLLATAALIITTAVDDSIDAWRFWILQTALTAFYLLSRGIAKSGTKSRS